MPKDTGTLTISAERAGAVAEISQFLADLESAYTALYRFDAWSRPNLPRQRRLMLDLIFDAGIPLPLAGWSPTAVVTPESILPEHRLVLTRVNIESPGFWEFLGSLNPLQQIREYLNDRHKRRQDKEFREAAEHDKLILENEVIQRQIWEKENSILRERLEILRQLGFTDEELRSMVWANVGKPLAQLGRHQDSKLIGAAEKTARRTG